MSLLLVVAIATRAHASILHIAFSQSLIQMMPFSCCARKPRRNPSERYKVTEPQNEEPKPISSVATPTFSWDKRDDVDTRNMMIQDQNETVVFKDDFSGPLVIENCMDSLIVVLGYMSAVNIDDCSQCTIILGPCSGSVFIRDTNECKIVSMCQQLRTRDCKDMSLSLRCMSEPIIEQSTNINIHPCKLTYPSIKKHLILASIDPLCNMARSVHDFTPDKSARNWNINRELVKIEPEYKNDLETQFEVFISSGFFPANSEEQQMITHMVYFGKTFDIHNKYFAELKSDLESDIENNDRILNLQSFDVDVIRNDISHLPLHPNGYSNVKFHVLLCQPDTLDSFLLAHPRLKTVDTDAIPLVIEALEEID